MCYVKLYVSAGHGAYLICLPCMPGCKVRCWLEPSERCSVRAGSVLGGVSHTHNSPTPGPHWEGCTLEHTLYNTIKNVMNLCIHNVLFR